MRRTPVVCAPFLVLLPILSGVIAWGQIPQTISYQGVLTDATGAVLPDGNYNLTFRLYDAATGGTALWSEGQLVALSKGIFNVTLGSVVPLSLPFDKPYWLGVTVGGGAELSPRIALTAAPYSLRSADAERVNGIAASATPAANSLFPLGADGKFPATVLPPGLPPGAHASTHQEGGTDIITVTSAMIQDGTITGSDIDPTATITAGKLQAGATTDSACGVYGRGQNPSSGPAYGGLFETSSEGTGFHCGVEARARGASLAQVYGVRGFGENTSSGLVTGGLFSTSAEGTGDHYGVAVAARGASTADVVGVISSCINTSSGQVYGGLFQTFADGTGEHYGVVGAAHGASSAWVYGVSGYGRNSSSGSVYGGLFQTSSEGMGRHHGVVGQAYGASGAWVMGVQGYGENTSSGPAYGGNFYVSSSGTGVHYGVYAQEAAGGTGAAVYAAGDLVASGNKSAVLRTSRGHRLMSVIESPEVWFEDFGEGQLVNGRAHVELDPLFLETVTINAEHPMKVFIQLRDDCRGTYVKTSTTGFDVFELQGGTSNASFSYRVVAKRKGYEGQRLEETAVGKEDPTLYPELRENIERMFEEERLKVQLHQDGLMQPGQWSHPEGQNSQGEGRRLGQDEVQKSSREE
ncbi:MAG: hypothetical protein ONB30_06260 [candidate division KSB1 bacterium]|nr:hypothetical protein [candidate division KSB1 bacterium]